jgi:hypothetical protein
MRHRPFHNIRGPIIALPFFIRWQVPFLNSSCLISCQGIVARAAEAAAAGLHHSACPATHGICGPQVVAQPVLKHVLWMQ